MELDYNLNEKLWGLPKQLLFTGAPYLCEQKQPSFYVIDVSVDDRNKGDPS